jgi:hypothetical protein
MSFDRILESGPVTEQLRCRTSLYVSWIYPFAFLRVPLATAFTAAASRGLYPPRALRRDLPPLDLRRSMQYSRVCRKLLRTGSQLLKLVPTIYQQDSRALVLIPQRAGGSLNISV